MNIIKNISFHLNQKTPQNSGVYQRVFVPRNRFERLTHSLEVYCSIQILINFMKRKIYVQNFIPTFIPTFFIYLTLISHREEVLYKYWDFL